MLGVLAHNLLRWTHLLGLPDTTVRSARTLRRRLLELPGRLTRHARGWTLHLPARWPWHGDYINALNRIRAARCRLRVLALTDEELPVTTQADAARQRPKTLPRSAQRPPQPSITAPQEPRIARRPERSAFSSPSRPIGGSGLKPRYEQRSPDIGASSQRLRGVKNVPATPIRCRPTGLG